MEELMDVKVLSKYLNVTSQTVYNWVSSGDIPHIKIGDLLRFKNSDIDDWLKKKTIKYDRLVYKGYEIEACPYPVYKSKWMINLKIWKHNGSDSINRSFSGSNTYDSKEEALKHCFNLGKKIIDGKVEKCTVEDL